MKKEFSKFFIASLKRTAMNVSALVREKQKLMEKVEEANERLAILQKQIDSYDAPIKEATGGFGVEDLVVRTVEVTDKVDKDGKPIKVTKWNLKYPETIVPEVPEAPEVVEVPEEGENVGSGITAEPENVEL